MPAAEAPPPFPPDFDPEALFREDGPIDPDFMYDAVHTVLRTLPLDPNEPRLYAHRRIFSTVTAIGALHPRDEIELMLAVQGVSAYHAAAACWRLGMNHHLPAGDSTRHISAAATAARTFDTVLRALERRQAKPLPVPRPKRPRPRPDLPRFEIAWAERITGAAASPDAETDGPLHAWTAQAIAIANDLREQERIEDENEGLDIANTEGIRPDGSMIVPEDPTPQQAAYLARRAGLQLKRAYAENRRKGIRALPEIPKYRPGDLIP